MSLCLSLALICYFLFILPKRDSGWNFAGMLQQGQKEADDQMGVEPSLWEQQKDALKALSSLPKDSELYKMQMEHLAFVTKLHFEADKLQVCFPS